MGYAMIALGVVMVAIGSAAYVWGWRRFDLATIDRDTAIAIGGVIIALAAAYPLGRGIIALGY